MHDIYRTPNPSRLWVQIEVPRSPLLGLWPRAGQSMLSSQCTLEWDNYFVLHIYRCQYYTCFKFAYSYFLVIHSGFNCFMSYLLKTRCSVDCSLTSRLVINQQFSPLKLLFISGHIFVMKFHHQLKYKLYSRLIENYSFSFFSGVSMGKVFKYSTGNTQKSVFNSAEQQMNGISSNLPVILYTHIHTHITVYYWKNSWQLPYYFKETTI